MKTQTKQPILLTGSRLLTWVLLFALLLGGVMPASAQDGAVDDLVQVGPLERGLERPALDPGHVQHVIDEAGQSLGGIAHIIQNLPAGF